MTTTLSSKGQVVLPKQARSQLHLRPGAKLKCEVQGDSILLTPQQPVKATGRLIKDSKTGLLVTRSPRGIKVTSEDVRAALSDFP